MEKYLYFADGNDADATGEAAIYPASALKGADATSATTATLYFKPQVVGDSLATGDINDKVVLTFGSGKIKEVLKALADKINEPVSKDNGFVVVCDADNSEFLSSVSGCVITYAA